MAAPHLMQPLDLVLSGQKLRVWKGGSGRCLLLLHAAWGGAELSWDRVWNELAHSFTVIAPDLPGFGRSGSLETPSLEGMAARLSEMLDALQIDRVIVAGNSFGAGLALRFAGDQPLVVSQVILVNGGYMPVIPAAMKKLAALPMLDPCLRSLVRMINFSPWALKRAFADPVGLPTGFLDSIARNAPAYSRTSYDIVMNMTRPLTRPAAPVTLLWGARDGLATLKQAEMIRKAMPDAGLVTIDGAGHMPQVERPEAFVSALRSLISAG
jgi:pimeloyl-ACP methyl ester carboxylesterase